MYYSKSILKCDGVDEPCNTEFVGTPMSVAVLRPLAAEIGWGQLARAGTTVDLCPECMQKKMERESWPVSTDSYEIVRRIDRQLGRFECTTGQRPLLILVGEEQARQCRLVYHLMMRYSGPITAAQLDEGRQGPCFYKGIPVCTLMGLDGILVLRSGSEIDRLLLNAITEKAVDRAISGA